MGLDNIKDLNHLNQVLGDVLERVNADDQSPLEVSYASRKFKLNIDDTNTTVKMKDIISKFKELAAAADSDLSLVGDLHDKIVLLDLQGDIALEKKGSTFLRNILNMRFLTSSHLQDIDAIQEQVFDRFVKTKATSIELPYTAFPDQPPDIKRILDDAFKSDDHFEIAKNALRYLAVKNPKLAHRILKDISAYLESSKTQEYNPQYVLSLKQLIHNLDIELSVRPKYRDATVEHGDKTRTLIQLRMIRELYEKDPKNFRKNFTDPKFLPGINKENKRELLKQLANRYPNAARLILRSLEKSPKKPDDLDNLLTILLSNLEKNPAAKIYAGNEEQLKIIEEQLKIIEEQFTTVKELYKNDPKNFRENFLDPTFLSGINKHIMLVKFHETHPKESLPILKALQKPIDELDKLRIDLLNNVENKPSAAQEPQRSITVKDSTSIDKAIANLIAFGKELSSEITLNEYKEPVIIFLGTKEELQNIKNQIEKEYNYLIPPNLQMEFSEGKLVIKNQLLTYLLAPQAQHDQMNVLMYNHLLRNAKPDDILLKQQIIMGAIRNLIDVDLQTFLKSSKITHTVLAGLSDDNLNLVTELKNEKPRILKDTFLSKQLAVIELQGSTEFNPFIKLIQNAIETSSVPRAIESSVANAETSPPVSIMFAPSYKTPKIKFSKSVFDEIKELLGNSEFIKTFPGNELILDYAIAAQLLIPSLYADSDQLKKMMYLKALNENQISSASNQDKINNSNLIVNAAIENLKGDEALKDFFKEAKIEISSLNITLKQKLETIKSSVDENKFKWDILSENIIQ